MMRGSIANTLSPTLWIHSDCVLKCKGVKSYWVQREIFPSESKLAMGCLLPTKTCDCLYRPITKQATV